MNELQTFNFEGLPVRTMLVNEESYFVGKDVAKYLGYSNTSKAVIAHVDKEDKITTMIPHSQNGNLVKTKTTLINESGLYSLIFSSKLDKAKRFKRWATSEVLPSIQKHGLYATEDIVQKSFDDPDYIISIMQKIKQEREEKRVAEQQVKLLQPKAAYYDKILNSKLLISVCQIAKDYGMSATGFNRLLNRLKIQYKRGKMWMLYAEHQDKGYTHSCSYPVNNDYAIMYTKWTQKGRLFLYKTLKEEGILPVIEK